MLRVIFVLGNLELGGAERQALILAKHLSEHQKATVEVWGFNKSGPVATICEQHGLAWRVVPYPIAAGPWKRFTSLVKLARTFREARPDVLLPYTLVPNTACGLIWKWTGARLCVWNQRDAGIALLTAKWERLALKSTSRFISNSQAGARFLIDKLNVHEAKVRVIPNGIEECEPKLDRQAWRKRLDIDDDSFVACKVANLHNNKDHRTLLSAWKRVSSELEARGRRAVLVLAGRHDGAYQSLVDRARELDIEGSIRFAGQVTDVSGLLSAADIGVFSSRSEGCPNAVLECMAAGLAVAGSDIDGVREVVGGAEFLAGPGDADGLARIILNFANDPVLCSRIGEENARRVRKHYDSRRMCEETVSLLLDSLA